MNITKKIKVLIPKLKKNYYKSRNLSNIDCGDCKLKLIFSKNKFRKVRLKQDFREEYNPYIDEAWGI